MNKFYFAITFIFLTVTLFAQERDTLRLAGIKCKLDKLVIHDNTYLNEVDISTSSISLSDMLQAIAKANAVNISINDGNNIIVSSNFSKARISDILYFVCSEYDLDIEIIGNIVSVYPYKPIVAIQPFTVVYDSLLNKISYDILNHKLVDVAKDISDKSGKNIIIPQHLYSKEISGYLTKVDFEDAILTLATTNDLILEVNENDIWTMIDNQQNTENRQRYVRRRKFSKEQLVIDSSGLITANITNGNAYDIILDICDKLKLNFHFISPINYQTSLFVSDATVETLFNVIFTGTECSYYFENNIYMFGMQSEKANINTTDIFQMKYRTITKVVEIIPLTIKKGVEVNVFPDLNSIIISGDSKQVSRIKQFLTSIDKSVPLITMEIIIVDVSKGFTTEVGLEMGYGNKPTETTGTLSPGINMQYGASSINRLINSFNGFGNVNLGTVSSNFYLNLKLMEDAGDIKLRSTPKLSTLNGHQATLTSGEKRYYKEVQSNFIGTQNPVQSESFTWQSVEANLIIKITPLVSLDNQITLDVDIEQSEFTAREEKEAPPGTATRKFKSIIRVLNGEMILLGGLERNSDEISSSGLPFLARIPVLRWLFGSSKKSKTTQKLSIFIKPTII